MKSNTRRPSAAPIRTHEGGRAVSIPPLAQLRRTVSSCFLWEDEFYEDGQSIATRIADLVKQCRPPDVAALALDVRANLNLRHVPLLLLRELARHPQQASYPQVVSQALAATIQRADEIPEFLKLYWEDGRQPLSKQVKRGLSWALSKFNEYQLGKYKSEKSDISIRDVMFMVHAKPKDAYERYDKRDRRQAKRDGVINPGQRAHIFHPQEALYGRIAEKQLKTPDTWEVELSSGADKGATFRRLLLEKKLGYLALLRNLRNMAQAGVDSDLINAAIRARQGGAERVLPFRFIAAVRAAPQFAAALDDALQATMEGMEKLPGKTIVLVDVSGSMVSPISSKSDLRRIDAAAGLAAIARGICEDVRIFAFTTGIAEAPAYRGLALIEEIVRQGGGGTELGRAVNFANTVPHDRLIVISDEQTSDTVAAPRKLGYMINIASAQNGVGYGPWVHIDGWSDSVVRFIAESEKSMASEIQERRA